MTYETPMAQIAETDFPRIGRRAEPENGSCNL